MRPGLKGASGSSDGMIDTCPSNSDEVWEELTGEGESKMISTTQRVGSCR